MKQITGEIIRRNMPKYFGKRVQVKAYYYRSRGYRGAKPNRKWARMVTAEKEGLLIGIRSLRNGNVSWYDDHSEWDVVGDPVPAFLVVFGSHLNPVYVPIDDLAYIPSGEEVASQAFALIRDERTKQNEKWGEQNHDSYRWLAILSEEVGEVAQAILHDEFGGRAAGTAKEELIQTAAVAVQWIECILRQENINAALDKISSTGGKNE